MWCLLWSLLQTHSWPYHLLQALLCVRGQSKRCGSPHESDCLELSTSAILLVVRHQIVAVALLMSNSDDYLFMFGWLGEIADVAYPSCWAIVWLGNMYNCCTVVEFEFKIAALYTNTTVDCFVTFEWNSLTISIEPLHKHTCTHGTTSSNSICKINLIPCISVHFCWRNDNQ